MSERRTEPHGLLRVSVQNLFGQIMMGRIAAAFVLKYPDIQLEVVAEDREVDLVKEGFDVVIRLNPAPTSELVGRCFAKYPIFIVSTQTFKDSFDKRLIESTCSVLPIISRSSANSTWAINHRLAAEVQTKVVLKFPQLGMIRDAILTGLGAAKLPGFLIEDDLLARRLVVWTGSDTYSELWALHSSNRLASAEIRAFMDFLKCEFAPMNIV